MFRVEYSEKALKQLEKLDRRAQILIVHWIEKHLVGCADPRVKGKGLVGDRRGEWRYRIGDYRLICSIRDSELLILALSVGHRCDIYDF